MKWDGNPDGSRKRATVKTHVFSIFLFVVVYVLVIAALYFGAILLPGVIFGYHLKQAAIVYIVLSASSIILTTWGEDISTRVKGLLLGRKAESSAVKALNERKIRFILILIYFVAIVVFTMASLTSHPVFMMEQMDYSVIQSFATYISYDRLIRNYPTIT